MPLCCFSSNIFQMLFHSFPCVIGMSLSMFFRSETFKIFNSVIQRVFILVMNVIATGNRPIMEFPHCSVQSVPSFSKVVPSIWKSPSKDHSIEFDLFILVFLPSLVPATDTTAFWRTALFRQSPPKLNSTDLTFFLVFLSGHNANSLEDITSSVDSTSINLTKPRHFVNTRCSGVPVITAPFENKIDTNLSALPEHPDQRTFLYPFLV